MTQPLDASVRAILLDIEGTTTPIDFVYRVLFPYAKSHVEEFLSGQRQSLKAMPDEVRRDLDGLLEQYREDAGQGFNPPALANCESSASLVPYVHWLIDSDRKVTPLKSLEGKIWAEGYARGELRSPVFEDVPAALKRWHQQNRSVAIFSSGSVLAQKLLFAHTQAGDLTGYLSGYFDTTTGTKTEPDTYKSIARKLQRQPWEMIFISDVVRELRAARTAGLEVRLCERPGNHPQPEHPYGVIKDFDKTFP